MIIWIDCIDHSRNALITADQPDEGFFRLEQLLRSKYPDLVVIDNQISLPWRAFLALRESVAQFVHYNRNCELRLKPDAEQILRETSWQSYRTAIANNANKPQDQIAKELANRGFKRSLTNNQLGNLSRIANLPAAATFSVPGAGKTTEALAYFFLNASDSTKLLVVAPKNAFGAWDEQLAECVGLSNEQGFVRLRGGQSIVNKLLSADPRFMLVSYSQAPLIKDQLFYLLSHNDVFVFLDESHRIKGGRGRAWADAVLDVSYLPKGKLILSGTPMPQCEKDLIPQFEFLYPDHPVNADTVVKDIQPLFVRTTTAELGIPEVRRSIISVPLSEAHLAVYQTIRSATKRELAKGLTRQSRAMLKTVGKSYIKLLQFASNPALLAPQLEYAFDPDIGKLLLSGDGNKIEYACKRARELVAENKKVLIWSSFVRNVELVASRLADLGAEYIHGGVDAGSDEEEDTREGKIKRFHSDDSCMVLVANPAACSEGISLHKVCRNAIYIDRTFNAAQYLQSEERIHRLGLMPDQNPEIEILQSPETIDEVVDLRLNSKVDRMAEVLNDPSLSIDAEFDLADAELGDELSAEDVRAVLAYFGLDYS